MKIVDFGIDEDCLVFSNEYKDIDECFENVKDFSGYFINECESGLIDSIDEKEFIEYFENDSGEIEKVKFKVMVDEINEFLKNNSDYVLVSFCVEYDNSFLLISSDDWNELKSRSEKYINELEEEY